MCSYPADSSPSLSFGTILWSPLPHQARILLEVLIDRGIHFFIVQGQASNELISLVEEKVAQSHGKGLSIDWAPQYAVLNHPVSDNIRRVNSDQKATGYFLTNGGSNSTLEAIRAKVPIST